MLFVATVFYAVFMSFTPGPNNILAMKYATNLGMKKTLHFLFGIGAGFLTLSILSILFNSLLLNVSANFYIILKIIGFVYLLYLAYQMVFTAHKKKRAGHQCPTFLQGYLLQFLNPKTILYVLTAMATYIVPHASSYFVLSLWTVTIAMIGFLASFTWAALGCAICKFLLNYERGFNMTMAFILVVLAFEILLSK
ncbi:LysE family translocator [Listeria sp. PSOL-1]|uniref:LysE family translocator n=1 Tax=Listeria sp. PSOL-1 TaxID=1844999 RepID=UPI0013D0CBFF|nr:LysE family translocator [Listeria sp. PSOL-1]